MLLDMISLQQAYTDAMNIYGPVQETGYIEFLIGVYQ